MNKDLEETVLKAVDYSNRETECYTKKVNALLLVGVLLWIFSNIVKHTELVGNDVMNACAEFAGGAAFGLIVFGIIVTSDYGKRLSTFEQRMMQRL